MIIPKISVLIITYNQQDLIGRALDSIISQREYVYEVIICDDCSTDNNWEVILSYANQFPELIKPIRNSCNLGIFKNIEKKWELPTGDIIYDLAGDDEVGENWFRQIVEYIYINKIDYKNELFCIYGDSRCIYPNGDTFLFKNNAIKSGIQPLKLYERGMINNRSCCYSIKILKKFRKVSQGRSYIAENAQDAQLHVFTESFYYIPITGNVYYSNIGVSTQLTESIRYEHEQTMVYAFNFFKQLGIKMDKYDLALPAYNIALKRMRHEKSFFSILNVFQRYYDAFDPKIGFRDIQIKRIIFSFLRRIPHKSPIHF